MASYVFCVYKSIVCVNFIIGPKLKGRGVLNPTVRHLLDFGGSKMVLWVFLDENSLGGNIFGNGPQLRGRGVLNPTFLLFHRFRWFKGGFICILVRQID